MKSEYDFSKAVRGKFYSKDAVHVPPIHLETPVLDFLLVQAHKQEKSLNELVNQMLKQNINEMKVAS